MPTAPRSRCSTYGCPHLTPCPDHARKPWANPSANTRSLNGADRRRFSKAVLTRDPTCRACGQAPAAEADHIIPVSQGGATHDPANGQGLCTSCHLAKTRRERAEDRTGKSALS